MNLLWLESVNFDNTPARLDESLGKGTSKVMQYRESMLERLDAAFEAAQRLPADGPVRGVLTDVYFDQQRLRIENESDFENALWPPLFVYVLTPGRTSEQIVLLDQDVTRIRDHSPDDRAQVAAWLDASATEGRRWRGGFFEASMKARTLDFASGRTDTVVTFDAPLPSGRNADICLTVGERSYFLECTVITESDEDQAVHEAWLESRKENPGVVLTRPGPLDPPGAKGPSPYYDANRFYIKVFDKLQKDGDRTKTQTADDSPNLLLLSCFPVFGSPLPFSPALGWAFDELFCAQPNMGSVKVMPTDSAITDISLMTFLRRQWPSTAHELIGCPARLSGTLVFNCLGFQSSRMNYSVRPEHDISHEEMVFLESVFRPIRGWDVF